MTTTLAVALEQAASTVEQTPPRRRRKVQHLYRMDYPTGWSLCGMKAGYGGTEAEVQVETVGGLMVVPEPDDCRSCVRMFESHLRRAERLGL